MVKKDQINVISSTQNIKIKINANSQMSHNNIYYTQNIENMYSFYYQFKSEIQKPGFL